MNKAANTNMFLTLIRKTI